MNLSEFFVKNTMDLTHTMEKSSPWLTRTHLGIGSVVKADDSSLRGPVFESQDSHKTCILIFDGFHD